MIPLRRRSRSHAWMACQDWDSFSLPVRQRVVILSSTTMSTPFSSGSIMDCPLAVDKSGMAHGCKSGVTSERFFNACGGMAMPPTREDKRLCMDVAGISPST